MVASVLIVLIAVILCLLLFRTRFARVTGTLALIMVVTCRAHAQVRYHVDQNGGSDSNLGTPDWDDAFATVQRALAAAQPGDEIWVANGTYIPSVPTDINDELDDVTNPCDDADRYLTFKLVRNVSMRGGFQGRSHPSGGETLASQADPVANITTLSGELGSAGISDNAYHVLVYIRNVDEEEINCEEASETGMVIDGFVITGGNASDGDHDPFTCTGDQRNGAGGGAFIEFWACESVYPVGPRFSRCVFENNFARIAGGGIATKKAGTTVIDCEFRANEQTENNPAVSMAAVNIGGGAVSSVGPTTIIKSKFLENISLHHGGGVVANTATTKVIDCEFRGNEAPAAGGADVSGIVVNTLFAGNRATVGNGGGLIGGNVHACTFADNFAEGIGAGANVPSDVANSLFFGNTWDGTGAPFGFQPHMGHVNVECATFKTDTMPASNSIYNLIENWVCPTSGATCDCGGSSCACLLVDDIADPKFIDRNGADNNLATFEDNDYRLAENSPAINAGDTGLDIDDDQGYFPTDEFDIDGDANTTNLTPELAELADRVYQDAVEAYQIIDVGAYEMPCFVDSEICGDCVTSATFADPPDGKVDAADLAFLLGEWGSPAPDPDSCADKVTSATFAPPPDGNVDSADLAYLLGSWGWCCDFSGGGQPLMGGGGESSGESSGEGESISVGPYEGTYIGLLLEELIATNDPDLVEVIQALLEE